MMPPSLSDMTPSLASLLAPQEAAAAAPSEAPLLPFDAVLSGTLALLPPSRKAGETASETEELLQGEHPVNEEPSVHENGAISPLQMPAWPEPAASAAAFTMAAAPQAPTNDAAASSRAPAPSGLPNTHALQTGTQAPLSEGAPIDLAQTKQHAPVSSDLPNANASQTGTPIPLQTEASLATGQTTVRASESSPAAEGASAPHGQQAPPHGEETSSLSRGPSQKQTPTGGSPDLQPANLHADPNKTHRETSPAAAAPTQAIDAETASLHETAPKGVQAVPLDPELPAAPLASHPKIGATDAAPEAAPFSSTAPTEAAFQPSQVEETAQPALKTKTEAPKASIPPQSETAQASKTTFPIEAQPKTAPVAVEQQATAEAVSQASPSGAVEVAEAARPAQGKATQENSQRATATQAAPQPQAATGHEQSGQETGQHAGSHRDNQESPAPSADTPAKTAPKEAADPGQRPPVATGLTQEQPAEEQHEQAKAAAHRDSKPEPEAHAPTRQPAVRPSEQASSPDAMPLPETATLPEAEAKLSGMEDALRTAAETQTETTAPGRKDIAGETPLFGRDPVRPAWLRAVQSRPLRTYAEAGWNVLEMQLDEGEGTVTIKARREEERVAVSVGFSDPTLRALASAQSDRLQQVLQAQYDSVVDFSLMNSGSDTSGRREDSAEAKGLTNATGAHKITEDQANTLPARGSLPGTRNEWVG